MRLFQASLDTCLGSPLFASLSVHGLHFTVYAASKLADFLVPVYFGGRLRSSNFGGKAGGVPSWWFRHQGLVPEEVALQLAQPRVAKVHETDSDWAHADRQSPQL